MTPQPDPLLGRVLDGRYRIEARLGEGGLGVVYRATHERLGRAFAIKVLQPEYAENAGLRARFEREARALGALAHPNVVSVTDFGIDGSVPYLVMELLEGRSLEEAIAAGLPPDRALAIARDVVAAVAFAHKEGLVHRDLKPANVFLQRVPDGGEVVRVLDFGLAKFLDESAAAALTRAGTAMGTPAYMSPEQAMGGGASPRNDVYSLGILLYEIVAGERPFRGHGGELMRQHLLEPMPSLAARRPEAKAAALLEPIVLRAAAKSPIERFADAGELRLALERALEGSIEIKSIAALAAPLSNAAADTVRDGERARERASLDPTLASVERASSARSLPAATVSASAPIPRAPDEPAPGSRRMPVLALLPLAILLPGAALALYTFLGGDGDAPARRGSAGAAPADDGPADAATPGAPEDDRDPWAGSVPVALETLRARVARGEPLDEAERATLRRLARSTPDDPRPWLLYGHADFAAGARTDAMTRYERAMAASPSARNDPSMLRNLVTMSYHRTVGERARALVRTSYGRAALPEIERARAERTDAAEIGALEALAAQIRAEGS